MRHYHRQESAANPNFETIGRDCCAVTYPRFIILLIINKLLSSKLLESSFIFTLPLVEQWAASTRFSAFLLRYSARDSNVPLQKDGDLEAECR